MTKSTITYLHRKTGRYRRRRARRRGYQLNFRASGELYLAVHKAAAARNQSINSLIEEALWSFLSKLASHSGAQIFERLRHANTLIQEVVAIAQKMPLQAEKDAANIHDTDPRQRRRNQLSEKTNAAFQQVYDLCQSERLAEENEMRASMYGVLAKLAAVNEMILEGASEEEILKEIREMNAERLQFEERTRELEEQAKA